MNKLTKILTEEVKNKIVSEMSSKSHEVYHIKDDNDFIENCETEDLANKTLEEYKKQYPNKNFTVERKCYDSYEKMLDEMDNMVDIKSKKTLRLNESEIVELIYKMVNEASTPGIESKKTLRLNESEIVELIYKMVNEASTPGIESHKKNHSESGKINNKHVKETDKGSLKVSKLHHFDQVDEGDKVTIQNSDKDEEYIENFRGNTLLDLNYVNEPSNKFKDRVKKSLEGHSTMGNSSDAANVIKTDIGKNLQKVADRKEKIRDNMPMYSKDPQPVKVVNESVKNDQEKMFKLISYKRRKK